MSRPAPRTGRGLLRLRTGVAGALRSFGTTAIRIGHALDTPAAQTAPAGGPPPHWVDVVRRRAPHLLDARADGDRDVPPGPLEGATHELAVDTGPPGGPAASRPAPAAAVDTGESARGPVVHTSRLGRQSPVRSMFGSVVRRARELQGRFDQSRFDQSRFDQSRFDQGREPLPGRRIWPFAGNDQPAPADRAWRRAVRFGTTRDRTDRTGAAAHLVRDLIGSKLHGSNLVGDGRDGHRPGGPHDSGSTGGRRGSDPRGRAGRVPRPRRAGRGERLGRRLADALVTARRAARSRPDGTGPTPPTDRRHPPSGSARRPATGMRIDAGAPMSWAGRDSWPPLPVPEQSCQPGPVHLAPIRLDPVTPTLDQPTRDGTAARRSDPRSDPGSGPSTGPSTGRTNGPPDAARHQNRTGATPPAPRSPTPPTPAADRWPDLPDDAELWTPPSSPGAPDARTRRLDDEQRGW